jgi:hypothetical protein
VAGASDRPRWHISSRQHSNSAAIERFPQIISEKKQGVSLQKRAASSPAPTGGSGVMCLAILIDFEIGFEPQPEIRAGIKATFESAFPRWSNA